VDSLDVLLATLARYCPEIGTITSFNDTNTALQGIRSSGIDLLFLVIGMPGMNGFELLQKLMPDSFEAIFVTARNEKLRLHFGALIHCSGEQDRTAVRLRRI